MGAKFEGVHLSNASICFDIRVTAADNVTSNLYRFVYGKPDSTFQFYAPGSSFDVERTLPGKADNKAPVHARWCKECETGMFSIGVDALQCNLCQPGTYANRTGSRKCDLCPAGMFTYTWGSEQCR